jgi:TRAP-type C4-dicarboxylate transport system permease small subunit
MGMEKEKWSIFGGLYKSSEVLAGIAFGILCGAVGIQVFARYIFGYSFGWAEEFPIFIFLWTCFIAAAAAYREDRHLGVTLLYDLFPQSFRRTGYYLNLGLSLVFFFFLFYYEMDVSLSMTSTFVTLKFSKAFHYIGIPIACLLFMVFIVEKIIKQMKEERRAKRLQEKANP